MTPHSEHWADLEGVWVADSVVCSGIPEARDEWCHLAWEFKGDRVFIAFRALYPRGTVEAEELEAIIDPTRDPAHLDLRGAETPKLVLTAVYRLSGNTLTVCWNAGSERPARLETTEHDTFTLVTLVRKR